AGRRTPVRCSLTATFLGGERAAVDEILARRARRRDLSPREYEAQLRAMNAFVGDPGEMADQIAPFVTAGAEALVLWPLEGDRAAAVGVLGDVGRVLTDRLGATENNNRSIGR